MPFKFTISSAPLENSNARTGIFTTPHGDISTPNFMPVGTKASVKTISQEELKTLNADVILANTYHLYIRPGANLIKEMGGLHKFMGWQKPILTDSGGFQVFSLAKEKKVNRYKRKITVKIKEDGVQFSSYLDGSKHFFSPEKVMEIEHDLGADIIMNFDECAPADASKKYLREAMERTHRWAIRCKKTHLELNEKQKIKQALFPIVQGGIYQDLREESAKFVNDLNLSGNAIGGLSVGETKEEMYSNIEYVVPHLSKEKPRYLMGVGTPEDLLEAVDRGIDLFDCVHPTRMARHGAFWTEEGRFNIKNQQFQKDSRPLSANTSSLCLNYSRSYLRHLFLEKEMLALRILSLHNLHFLLDLMQKSQQEIKKGNFKKFKNNFLTKYLAKQE